ncbi:MAG TPA: MurR/RpiR family transcriptional regulator [Acidimicrobiales bacterium]|nr:MurR/RpiR family transcriptional regulator [Acidimicrobiales bacterium]
MTEMISAVAERVAQRRTQLSPAERRVASVVLDQPEAVAFGTVARVAERAATSGASVVRLAAKLGYDGFAGLQAAVQLDIGQQLRPAVERIRGAVPTSRAEVVARTLRSELDNVEHTLRAIEPRAFDRAVTLLAQRSRPVRIVAGDAEAGVGAMLATALGLLRPDVAVVEGSDVAVARQLAQAQMSAGASSGPGEGASSSQARRSLVLVAIDLRRYERWVVEHTRRAAAEGSGGAGGRRADVIALTDSLLSPLAESATVAFTVQAEGAGPFDSHVGTLALVNALVTGVAGRLRRSAAPRLSAVEAAWRRSDALLDP